MRNSNFIEGIKILEKYIPEEREAFNKGVQWGAIMVLIPLMILILLAFFGVIQI